LLADFVAIAGGAEAHVALDFFDHAREFAYGEREVVSS